MLAFPHAKINIGLNIIEKRLDGFHNIETVFYPISWCDALEIIRSEQFNFDSTGIKIQGKADNNLCIKAYQLLKKQYDLPAIEMYLLKKIPVGSGLGGGSSDAAFTIQMLNKIFELKLRNKELKNHAKQLGSDCTFFMNEHPAFASGKGDNIEPIELNLSQYQIVIAYPEIHIDTAKAYKQIQAKPSKESLKKLIQLPVKYWKDNIHNDFEENIFKQHAQIADMKKQLYQAGAVYASMSGSGSAMYGIFDRTKNLTNIYRLLQLDKQYVYIYES